jgi:vacuolar-type H+-ATPase subunit B/Vma2
MIEPTSDASIPRILQAEGETRDAVEQCRREAEVAVEAAVLQPRSRS